MAAGGVRMVTEGGQGEGCYNCYAATQPLATLQIAHIGTLVNTGQILIMVLSSPSHEGGTPSNSFHYC